MPTSSESSSWTSTLTSGAVTRADLLDGIAQSSEHLAIAGAVIGGSGNDTIYSRDGADTIDGGASVDVVDYSLLSIAGVNVDLATGIAVQANGSTDILANIENVNGGSGNNVLAGDGGTNILTGGSGNDTLSGNGGNDTLDGGSGTDAMTGGAGDDVYVVNDAGDAVMELPGEGVDEVRTTLAAYTLGANVEKLTFTGAGVFAGTGNALDNTLIGGTGNDTLDGGVGVDAMIGGLGDDIYLVDNASDTVTELAGEGTDEVHTTLASYALAANVERLVYTGSAAFTGTGNAIDNILTGGTGNDTLSGETAATCTCTAPARAPT